jgi:two-component system response regulator AtoC
MALEHVNALARRTVVTEDAGSSRIASYERLFQASAAMHDVERLVRRAVIGVGPVLIEGETGTGKELVADAVHALSDRAAGPCVKLPCGALPGERFDAELFGQELPGPGGTVDFAGRIDAAAGGTLFLDEIADVPGSLHARLLHLVEESRFYRNGGRREHLADVRIIASTHRNLAAMVASGAFRADLYQRLAATTIRIPPLRERREEIGPLVDYFCAEFCRELRCARPAVSTRTMEVLGEYAWPGNVRELQNLVRRFVMLGDERFMREEIAARTAGARRTTITPAAGEGLRSLGRRAAREAERAAIADVLARVNGNRAEAARRLKVSYKTLLAKLKTR